MHPLSVRSKTIFSSAVCCCVTPSQTLLLRCDEPCQNLSSPALQLLSSHFPPHHECFVFHPPSVPIYLSITYAWRGSAPQRGSRWIFSLLSRQQKMLSKNLLISCRVSTLSPKFPWGSGSFPAARRLMDADPVPSCVMCSLMRWLMECDTLTEADPVSSWPAFCNLTVASQLFSDHVYPLCYEIRAYLIPGLPESGKLSPENFLSW